MMNTIENNRLIAEFMGIVPHVDKDNPKNYEAFVQIPNSTCPNGYHVEEAKYHSSWNWLMPVVEKIESININNHFPDVEISKDCTIDLYVNKGADCKTIAYGWSTSADKLTNRTKIEAVYDAVIQFIKWHNSNQPPTINQ